MTRWPIGCWDTPGSAESETRGDPGRAGERMERAERAERAEINRNQQKSASILQYSPSFELHKFQRHSQV